MAECLILHEHHIIGINQMLKHGGTCQLEKSPVMPWHIHLCHPKC